jgi:hypothetical protein
MSKHSIFWHAVVESERLERPSRRRWTTVLTLGTIATAYYFSIPAMLAWAPGRLRLHVTEREDPHRVAMPARRSDRVDFLVLLRRTGLLSARIH